MSYAVMPLSDWKNILDSVKAKTGKGDLLVSGNIASEIDKISGGNGDIPTYHFIESARMVENILAFKAAHPNHLVFGAISDVHVFNADASHETGSKASAKHASFALETVGAMAECDFIANLGDNCWENGIETDNAILGAKYAMIALKSAFARLVRYNLVGNHDRTSDTQGQFDLIGAYNAFDDHGTTKIRGFGYKDHSAKKVRVICLNTCDYLNAGGGCALSYEQKDFLLRALDLSAKANASEWKILLLSHIPLDWNGGDYNFYNDLQTILNAYEYGTTASIPVNSAFALNETPSEYATYSGGSLVYNYSGKNAAKIIANVHGHVHTNAYGKLANTHIVRVATANANPDLNKSESYPDYGDYSITATEATKIVKISNTAKDTSATFYCIDLDEQVIYAYGYGADVDRIIPFKDATVYSVICKLTDVASSNTVASAIEGSAFTTTLSVGSDYTLESVTVTMGGVDVTAMVYSNGVINIPEVTGNIVITATAKDHYIPVWDIADRSAVTGWYLGAQDPKALSRKHYYYGATSTGMIDYRKISDVIVSGNDVTFTSAERNYGIGLPYHLEAGATYTFSCTASANARLRQCVLSSNGTFVSESYSSSGTTLSLTITAPTDETQWVMLILDTNTAGTSITYTNIRLTKNEA